MRTIAGVLAVVVSIIASACSGQAPGGAPTTGTPSAAAKPSPNGEDQKPESALPEDVRGLIDKTFAGDLEAMVSRRLIRAGVPFNRTFYFIDKGTPRGLSYEYLMLFEEELNKQRKTRQPEGPRRHAADAARRADSRAARPARSTWSSRS